MHPQSIPVACFSTMVVLFFCGGGTPSDGANESTPQVKKAATYYVDIEGHGGQPSDKNPGTLKQPWQTVLHALRTARPGDTVIFRQGIYRQPRTLHTSDFPLSKQSDPPIILKGYPGETVVISTLRAVKANEWVKRMLNDGTVYFVAPVGRSFRVTNVVQNGVPLRRANTGSLRNVYEDTPPERISGPGEWSSSIREGEVYLRTEQNRNPQNSIELCDIGGFGASGTLINLAPDEKRFPQIRFEDLTLETGFHGLLIRNGFVTLKNCTLQKSFGDLFNSHSGRFIIDGCDFQAFGESAIDVTGPGVDESQRPLQPANIIRNCQFHGNAIVRWPGQKGYNAVMLKGGCREGLVESNRFYDLEVTYGVLTLGGASGGGQQGEGINLVARNNIVHDVTGPYAVLFSASRDCSFVNNLIIDSKVDDIIRIMPAKRGDPTTQNQNPRVQNNIFTRNEVKNSVLRTSLGEVEGLKFNANLLFESGRLLKKGDSEQTVQSSAQPPLFKDSANHDYRTQPGSPVIDAGQPLKLLVSHDYRGTPRPQNSLFDIGPYEMKP